MPRGIEQGQRQYLLPQEENVWAGTIREALLDEEVQAETRPLGGCRE